MSGRPALFVLTALLLVTAGCSSVPTPTYRDFEILSAPVGADSSLTGRLRLAAQRAGWTIAPSGVGGTVTTEPRLLSSGTLSRTTAVLDLIPFNEGRRHASRYVRVVVRAERRSFLGGRSKVYALDGDLRAEALGPIGDALSAQGLVALGTPRDRDEDATDE